MMLWANGGRSHLEAMIAEGNEAHEDLPRLQAWVTNQLSEFATEGERARHARPAGRWSEVEIINDSWDREAASMVAWAVGLVMKAPAWNESMSWPSESDDFYEFPESATWHGELALRDPEAIEQLAQTYEVIHWRLRSVDDLGYAKKLLKRASQLGQITLAKDEDLALSDGRSIAEVSQDEMGTLVSIVVERHQALNWLCGQDPDWDEISCDTIVSWLWDEHWK